jgi:hypothetical protein
MSHLYFDIEAGSMRGRGKRSGRDGKGYRRMRLMRNIGNVGILTGPAFFTAIAVYMNGTNQLAIQGVDYDADAEGFLAGGDQEGANTMSVAGPYPDP